MLKFQMELSIAYRIIVRFWWFVLYFEYIC